jgi:hypothetical protein
MSVKVGNIYRNRFNNITVIVKAIKGDNVHLMWSFKPKPEIRDLLYTKPQPTWLEIVDNGEYVEYHVQKGINLFNQELIDGHLMLDRERKDNIILNWIPHHTFYI